MRRATTYRCVACSNALLFDDGEHALHCEACDREYSLNMQPR